MPVLGKSTISVSGSHTHIAIVGGRRHTGDIPTPQRMKPVLEGWIAYGQGRTLQLSAGTRP